MKLFRTLRARANSIASRFAGERSGAVAIITAAALTMMIGLMALAVDAGYLYLERRTAQGAVDLAAMASASDMPRAEAAANATLAANGVTKITNLKVVKGQYTPDPQVAAANRFKANVQPYNAVKIELQKEGPTFFASYLGASPINIGVQGIAASVSEATFSIGSRLLAVRDGVVNDVLGGLLGSNINLSVMDYDALLKADVKLQPFLDALATQLNVKAGTYQDVITSRATVGDILKAMASVTTKNGDAKATAALTQLLGQSATSSLVVPLTALINLGSYASLGLGEASTGLAAAMNVMELLSASAALGNGQHQVTLNIVSTIPGVSKITVDLTIGEPAQQSAWVTVASAGNLVQTAQTRLRIVAEIGGSGLLAGVTVRLPIYLELARAQGRLSSVSCAGGDASKATATVATTPGVALARIGEVDNSQLQNFSATPPLTKATLAKLLVVSVLGSSEVYLGNISETPLSFAADDVTNKTIKRTDSRNLTESLVTSLLGKLKLEAKVLGLSLLSPDLVMAAVSQTLAAVAAPLDAVVYTLLTTLGVHLGEADVRVHGIRCGSPSLAG